MSVIEDTTGLCWRSLPIFSIDSDRVSDMWPRLWKLALLVLPSAAVVLAVLYITYRFIDPIPPRHFAIAAGMAGSGYDNFAKRYARILARNGVELEVRNAAGAVEDLDLLRDGASGVQAGSGWQGGGCNGWVV
jgi:hypothetical protein